jgi:hypothetical protein
MRRASLVAYAGIYPRSVEMQGVVAQSSTQPSSAWEAAPQIGGPHFSVLSLPTTGIDPAVALTVFRRGTLQAYCLVPELTGSASSCCFQFQGSSLSSWFVFSLPGRDAFQHVGQPGDLGTEHSECGRTLRTDGLAPVCRAAASVRQD